MKVADIAALVLDADATGMLALEAIHLPSFPDVPSAFAFLEGQGEVVRLVLYRGPDGWVRGRRW
jgi:uncharacterized protein YhfF